MATQTVGGITIYDAAASLHGAVAAPTGSDELVLVRVGAYAGAGPSAAGRAESVAFDASTGRLLVTTFRFEETYGLDPVATLLLNRLAEIALE